MNWSSLGSSGYKHSSFLITRDLFEYSKHGYKRHQDVGRDSDYDWNEIGDALNGTTYVPPDDLEESIIDSNDWTGNEYSHNCQDFVQFCLRQVGCHETMIQKDGPVYK